ncbi:MAG: hypothetical protein MJH10_13300 [Epibacterium sp.]|nr:hypothetical protein [Epibacterium sp.]NQX74517.1 hypothetical protein [Epibacterium sp.]
MNNKIGSLALVPDLPDKDIDQILAGRIKGKVEELRALAADAAQRGIALKFSSPGGVLDVVITKKL